jgi:hypothetical protein
MATRWAKGLTGTAIQAQSEQIGVKADEEREPNRQGRTLAMNFGSSGTGNTQ